MPTHYHWTGSYWRLVRPDTQEELHEFENLGQKRFFLAAPYHGLGSPKQAEHVACGIAKWFSRKNLFFLTIFYEDVFTPTMNLIHCKYSSTSIAIRILEYFGVAGEYYNIRIFKPDSGLRSTTVTVSNSSVSRRSCDSIRLITLCCHCESQWLTTQRRKKQDYLALLFDQLISRLRRIERPLFQQWTTPGAGTGGLDKKTQKQDYPALLF